MINYSQDLSEVTVMLTKQAIKLILDLTQFDEALHIPPKLRRTDWHRIYKAMGGINANLPEAELQNWIDTSKFATCSTHYSRFWASQELCLAMSYSFALLELCKELNHDTADFPGILALLKEQFANLPLCLTNVLNESVINRLEQLYHRWVPIVARLYDMDQPEFEAFMQKTMLRKEGPLADVMKQFAPKDPVLVQLLDVITKSRVAESRKGTFDVSTKLQPYLDRYVIPYKASLFPGYLIVAKQDVEAKLVVS